MVSKRSAPMKSGSRREDTRVAKPIPPSRFLSFCFRFLKENDSVGQSIEQWEADGLLGDLFRKMVHACSVDITTLQTQKSLTNYGKFPVRDVTDFSCPTGISADENWAVLRNIGGQKKRVAGFINDDVFHVVFLDRDHRFWKSER